MFAADLRLPRSFTEQQRRERVGEVMEAMGITHITGVIIGDALNKARRCSPITLQDACPPRRSELFVARRPSSCLRRAVPPPTAGHFWR